MTIQPARIAAAIMKIAPKLDIENLVAIEEILGGGAVAACSVDTVSDEVLDAAGLDCADPDAADDALAALCVDEVVADVDDDGEDDVEVPDELGVEVTVDVIVN